MDVRKPFADDSELDVQSVEISTQKIFTVATDSGFRTYNIDSGKLNISRELDGSLGFATNVDGTNIFGIVGGGPSPAYPPNKFLVWADEKKDAVLQTEANLAPIRACLTRTRYALVFEGGVRLKALFLGDEVRRNTSPDATIGNYQTVANPQGLCWLGKRRLLCPGMSTGQARVVELSTRRVTIVPAHKTALQAIALSPDEELIATASEQGTLIRIWSASDGAKVCEFRRGLDQAIILSLAFSPSGQHLAVTSDKSTMHIFDLPGGRQQAEVYQRDNSSIGTKLRSSSSSSRPMSIPASKSTRPPLGAAFGTSPTTGASGSPSSRDPKRISFPSPAAEIARLNLSSSPSRASPSRASPSSRATSMLPSAFDAQSNVASLTPSDAISQQGPTPALHSAPAWNDLYRAQPQPGRAGPSSVAGHSTADSAASSSSSSTARAQKYGGLANLPFAPRILSDTYSSLTIPFEIGDESRHLPRGATMTDLMRTGRLQKGKIAWIDDDQLVVVGAGRDARWEKFRMGFDVDGNRAIERVGWKRYMEDDGLY